jgi:hypothetical protein
MTLSPLELRHIIESGCLPLDCRCVLTSDNTLTIELLDPQTGFNIVSGAIPIASLNTSRAIAELIGSLRTQLLAQRDSPMQAMAGLRRQ